MRKIVAWMLMLALALGCASLAIAEGAANDTVPESSATNAPGDAISDLLGGAPTAGPTESAAPTATPAPPRARFLCWRSRARTARPRATACATRWAT